MFILFRVQDIYNEVEWFEILNTLSWKWTFYV